MIKLNALLLTTLSVFASTAAYAAAPSTLTRAEVTAEYQRARAAGELPITGYETAYTVKKPAAKDAPRPAAIRSAAAPAAEVAAEGGEA